ncbi:MAG: hypothetical protein SVY10_03420 [Thermodesulfobacteriota bacterium]|nr:hypothetical protein [Thermodesulfobacteriota bacterium]
MTIEFKSLNVSSTILNPLKNFEEDTIEMEIRYDPLLGERCDACHFVISPRERTDLKPMIEKSLERPCPFCPELVNTFTPKFLPNIFQEGRINRGEAWLIPNIFPWTLHNPLIVVSSNHFVGMGDFNPDMLTDAMALSQMYMTRIREIGEEVNYWSVGWNYMPPSGGSQVHPHLQVMGQNQPTPLEEKVINASKEYSEQYGSIYFQDLVQKEKELGVRYLGETGDISWIVNFVSRSWLFEVLAVFHGKKTINELSQEELHDFSDGLVRVMKHCDSKNLYSANLNLFSCNDHTRDFVPTYARFVPRFLYSPVQAADASIGRILHDWCFMFLKPEEVCKEMKPFFEED